MAEMAKSERSRDSDCTGHNVVQQSRAEVNSRDEHHEELEAEKAASWLLSNHPSLDPPQLLPFISQKDDVCAVLAFVETAHVWIRLYTLSNPVVLGACDIWLCGKGNRDC